MEFSVDGIFEKRKIKLKFKNKNSGKIEIRESKRWFKEDNLPLKEEYLVFKTTEKISKYPFKGYPVVQYDYYIEKINEKETEISFPIRNHTLSLVYELEKMNLFQMTQKLLPDYKRQFFVQYINPKGFQVLYNIIVCLTEIPLIIYKKHKDKKVKHG